MNLWHDRRRRAARRRRALLFGAAALAAADAMLGAACASVGRETIVVVPEAIEVGVAVPMSGDGAHDLLQKIRSDVSTVLARRDRAGQGEPPR